MAAGVGITNSRDAKCERTPGQQEWSCALEATGRADLSGTDEPRSEEPECHVAASASGTHQNASEASTTAAMNFFFIPSLRTA
jgi:hypothetical protein